MPSQNGKQEHWKKKEAKTSNSSDIIVFCRIISWLINGSA